MDAFISIPGSLLAESTAFPKSPNPVSHLFGSIDASDPPLITNFINILEPFYRSPYLKFLHNKKTPNVQRQSECALTNPGILYFHNRLAHGKTNIQF